MRLAALLAALSIAVLATPARADGPDLSPRLALLGTSTVDAALVRTDPAPRPTTIFGLPRNIGPVERVLRAGVAATLVGLGAYRMSTDKGSDAVNGLLMGVAAVPAGTAATGYCPLYHLLGIEDTF